MVEHDPLEQLVEEHFLERTRRSLRAQVGGPDVSDAMIADAIATATLVLVERMSSQTITNLGGYFFKTAKHELLSMVSHGRRHVSIASDTPGRTSERPPDHVESQVESGLVYRFLMGIVAGWTAQREADVVRLVLEAAHEGLDLDTSDYLEAFEESTGEPITIDQLYDLKSRGRRRLRRDLEALAAQDDLPPEALIDG